MKILYAILFILIPVIGLCDSTTVISAGTSNAVSVGTTSLSRTDSRDANDYCSGGLVFSWHMEDTDLTVGTPGGCSILGDLVGAQSGVASLSDSDKSDGTYSIDLTNNVGHYGFGLNSSFPNSEGTIYLDFNITNRVGTTDSLLYAYGDDINRIILYLTGADGSINVTAYHYGNNDLDIVASIIGIDSADGKWWRLKYQWEISTGHKMDTWELDNSTPREITGDPVSWGPDDTLTLFSTPINALYIGNQVDSATSTILIDNVKIYSTSDL